VNFRPHAYKHLTFNTPLSNEHAVALVQLCSPATSILDLGCGWGELLLRLVAANPDSTGLGIDNDAELPERGRRLAEDRQLRSRVKFEVADAKSADGIYDLIVSIGSTHIWGSEPDALRFFSEHLTPGGKLLFGSGVYNDIPPLEIKDIFGELPTYAGLQNIVGNAGFTIINADRASLQEWDDFESTWRRGLEESNDPEIQAFARERSQEYEYGYRGILGFCYVVARK
jgi:cyclopropane fatty-acyl-phospholipid synthase-like methyltransferase